jgi:hypothetical protein
MFNASTVSTSGVVVNTAGGIGGMQGAGLLEGDDGKDGRVVVGSNAAFGFSSSHVINARTEVYDGLREANPFIKGSPQTPLIPDLAGGAEGFGLLNGLTARSSDILGLIGFVPHGAVAALLELPVGPVGYGEDFTGYDMLLFINMSSSALASPMLGIDPAGLDPTFSSSLLLGGVANDVQFGGSGARVMSSLGGYAIYATLIPEGGTIFNIGYDGLTAGGIDLSKNNGRMFVDALGATLPVPEPTSWTMFVVGLSAMALMARRRRVNARG